MVDSVLAVKQVQSTAFLPVTPEEGCGISSFYGDDGEFVRVNGEDKPLLNEDFRLSVVQPGSVKNDKALQKHVGQVRIHYGEDTEDDAFFDELFLMPISILGYSFAKFEKFDGKATSPVCSSSNGWFPNVKNDFTPISKQCARYEIVNGIVRPVLLCPACTWGPDGEKPSCTHSVRVAFLTIPGCVPVTMALHGVGMSAFNALLRQLNKMKNVARIKKRDLSRYAVKLFTDNLGTYVATKFSFEEAPEEYGSMKDYIVIAQHLRDTLFNVSTADRQPTIADEPGEEEAELEAEVL